MATIFKFKFIGCRLDETDITIKIKDTTVEINEEFCELIGNSETSTKLHEFDSIYDMNHFIVKHLNELKKWSKFIKLPVCEGWITGVLSMEVEQFNRLRDEKKIQLQAEIQKVDTFIEKLSVQN
jgi:hypothetical protein